MDDQRGGVLSGVKAEVQAELGGIGLEAVRHALLVLNIEPKLRGHPLGHDRLKRPRDRRERQGAIENDVDGGLPVLAQFGGEVVEPAGAFEHAPPRLEHTLACRVESDVAALSMEQRDADCVFEPSHRVADGRRDAVEVGGGGCERAEAGDGVEHEELIEGEWRADGPSPEPGTSAFAASLVRLDSEEDRCTKRAGDGDRVVGQHVGERGGERCFDRVADDAGDGVERQRAVSGPE